MRRGIAHSLSAKVFLLTAALLTAGCLALYLAVAVALPGGYRALSAARAEEAAAALAAELAAADPSEAARIVERFASENGAAVTLSGGFGSQADGAQDDGAQADDAQTTGAQADGAQADSVQTVGAGELGLSAYTVTVAVELADGSGGLLTITDSSGALGIIADVFARLFPSAAALILVVAGVGAWACTCLVARPVVRIADISERLSRLDMTWSCDERRHDEVGVLARSLNTMAARLERTIGDLTDANERLRREADAAVSRERERRDFLAAASHELKTPLAAARAQVEGMELGIGDFADHAAHLPRVRASLDRMDFLVRAMLASARADGAPADEPERFDARAVVAEALAASREVAASRGVEFAFDDGAPFPVCAERGRLEMAVGNAVANAARYALPATCVAVLLEGGVLRVENRCEPLPADVVARLGEPFFRPDASRSRDEGGSGLGLYLVKRSLDRLGTPFALTCADGVFVFEADLSSLAPCERAEGRQTDS